MIGTIWNRLWHCWLTQVWQCRCYLQSGCFSCLLLARKLLNNQQHLRARSDDNLSHTAELSRCFLFFFRNYSGRQLLEISGIGFQQSEGISCCVEITGGNYKTSRRSTSYVTLLTMNYLAKLCDCLTTFSTHNSQTSALQRYNFRHCSHSLELPPHTTYLSDSNFIIGMLYKDKY